jgi:hypothetical protein
MGRTYPEEIDRILHKPGGDVGKFLRALALEVADEGKRIAKVELGIHPGDRQRTRQLENAFEVKVVPGTNTFRVRNRKKYFDPLEFGVPDPHEIRARRVDYLQFRGRDGRLRRVKVVIHPGNRAYRILGRAGDKVFVRRFGTLRRG